MLNDPDEANDRDERRPDAEGENPPLFTAPKSVRGFGVRDKAKWAKADKVGAVTCSVRVRVTRYGKVREKEKRGGVQ